MDDLENVNTNNEPQEDPYGELLQGDWPGLTVEPAVEPEAEGAEKVEPDKVEPDKVEPDKVEPEPKPDPVIPEPKLYKFRGKEYTADQLIAQGLLEDALTSAEQMPHYQRKYETLLEQQRMAPAEPAQPQPQQPRITPEQIVSHYSPIADQAVNEGWIEPEMMTVFPKFTTNMMYYRDTINQLQQVVGLLANREQQRDLSGLRERVDGFIENTCLGLSNKAKHFELLKEDNVRSDFREYLYKLDPKVDSLNEDYIRTQWLAYNSEALIEALRTSNAQTQAAQDTKRRLAKGEGAGSPRTIEPKKEETHIDSLLEGSFPSGG